MTRLRGHPDNFAGLIDWPMYGPRDERIADMVDALAATGMRLAAIEDVIREALEAKIQEIGAEMPPPPAYLS